MTDTGARRAGSPPTIHDVARLAGVSAKTVSRLLNSEPGVALATADRIRAAVAELGFRRNDAARMLRTGAPERTIGLVANDFGAPNWAGLARSLQAAARSGEYLLLAATSQGDPEIEKQVLRHLLDRGVRGLVVVPAGEDHRYLERDLEQGLPMVFVGRPAGLVSADCVVADHQDGARQATAHLLRHWHRRIALVGEPPEVFGAAERVEGYRQALAAHGIGVDPELVRTGNRDGAEVETTAAEMLSLAEPPTAIVAAASSLAEGVGRAIAGSATALVAFDGPEISAALRAHLTVVGYDSQEMSRRATEMLFDRLGDLRSPVRTILLPAVLTARGSGESRPQLGDKRPAARSWFRR